MQSHAFHSTIDLRNIVRDFFTWRDEQYAILALGTSDTYHTVIQHESYADRPGRSSYLGGLWKLGGPIPSVRPVTSKPITAVTEKKDDIEAKSRYATVFLSIGRDIRRAYAPLFARNMQLSATKLIETMSFIYMHE